MEKYTFENYNNSNNRFAKVTLEVISNNLGTKYNPLFILITNEKYNLLEIFENTLRNNNTKILNCNINNFCINELNDLIDSNEVFIIKNLEQLENNILLQKRLIQLIEATCYKNKQIILCSNKDLECLNIDLILKSKIYNGLRISIY